MLLHIVELPGQGWLGRKCGRLHDGVCPIFSRNNPEVAENRIHFSSVPPEPKRQVNT